MGYPYTDNLIYADATTVLAVAVKFLGLGAYAIQLYNLFFLLTFLMAPIIAFFLANELKIKAGLDILFALFVVWMNPMMMHWGEWSNLSLSLVYLLAFYLIVRAYKMKSYYKLAMCTFLLILISSFIHLYYFLILNMVFAVAYFVIFFQREKQLSVFGFLGQLLAAATVVAIIYGSDGLIDQRPDQILGVGSASSTAIISDYFRPYPYLSLPSIYSGSWNDSSPLYLGGYFPLLLLAVIVYFLINKSSALCAYKAFFKNHALVSLTAASAICFFSSLGMKIFITPDISVYNFFNPLNYLNELIPTFKQFRYVSRFGHVGFLGISLLSFVFLSHISTKFKLKSMGAAVVICICLMMSIELLQVVIFSYSRFDKDNLFSQEILDDRLPTLDTESFDAILPIPYYHVGAETKGLIIDDVDRWSRLTYMMAIKYKKPLMAQKTSRASVENTKRLFTIFSEDPDTDLSQKLKGKSVLICYSKKHQALAPVDDPAKTVVLNQDTVLNAWEKIKIAEKDSILYFLKEF